MSIWLLPIVIHLLLQQSLRYIQAAWLLNCCQVLPPGIDKFTSEVLTGASHVHSRQLFVVKCQTWDKVFCTNYKGGWFVVNLRMICLPYNAACFVLRIAYCIQYLSRMFIQKLDIKTCPNWKLLIVQCIKKSKHPTRRSKSAQFQYKNTTHIKHNIKHIFNCSNFLLSTRWQARHPLVLA